jgi:hypothetical protein
LLHGWSSLGPPLYAASFFIDWAKDITTTDTDRAIQSAGGHLAGGKTSFTQDCLKVLHMAMNGMDIGMQIHQATREHRPTNS